MNISFQAEDWPSELDLDEFFSSLKNGSFQFEKLRPYYNLNKYIVDRSKKFCSLELVRVKNENNNLKTKDNDNALIKTNPDKALREKDGQQLPTLSQLTSKRCPLHSLTSSEFISLRNEFLVQSGPLPSDKLFFTNVPSTYTNDQVRQFFESFGELSDFCVFNRESKSCQFGFATFIDLSTSAFLLENNNQHVIDGKKISISPALPEPIHKSLKIKL